MHGAVGFAALGAGRAIESLIYSGDPLKTALGLALFAGVMWIGIAVLRIPRKA